MTNNKPTIVIKYENKCLRQLSYVLEGIEEEGLFFDIEAAYIHNPIQSAYDASKKSLLGVGIAVSDVNTVLHINHLDENKPLFVELTNNDNKLRMLGINAARYVKGRAFRL